MDPATAALLVGASINMASGLFKGRQVSRADKAQIGIEVEQAKLQAEQQALSVAKQYREIISYNAALSAMGFGGATGFRSISAASESAANRDILNLSKSQRFAEITGKAMAAGSTLNRLTGNVQTGLSTLSLANDFGMFAKKKQAVTGG